MYQLRKRAIAAEGYIRYLPIDEIQKPAKFVDGWVERDTNAVYTGAPNQIQRSTTVADGPLRYHVQHFRIG